MRVVIVHDYLNQLGGAERVVGVLHQMYPEAPIYTLFSDTDKLWPSLRGADIRNSFLQRFKFVIKNFKLFFWLYPLVMRTLKLPECDVVISSSSAYAKGIRLPKSKPIHLCYCHTPMRFAWNFNQYMAHETQSKTLATLARVFIPLLKWWDVRTAGLVDHFITNSSVVRERVLRCYKRDAEVIYPPVELQPAPLPENLLTESMQRGDGYFLVVSRLVSYKRLDLAVAACTSLNLRLFVIGVGPDRQRLEQMAGRTVTFLGWQPDETVRAYMASCTALIFPGEEDFGLTPVEVNSLGRPVVAYAAGGALDTIVDGQSGVLFREPTVISVAEALLKVQDLDWNGARIQQNAMRFDRSVFEQKLAQAVQAALHQGASVPSQAYVTQGEGFLN